MKIIRIFSVVYGDDYLKKSLRFQEIMEIGNDVYKDSMEIKPYLSDGSHPIEQWRFEGTKTAEEALFVVLELCVMQNEIESFELKERIEQENNEKE